MRRGGRRGADRQVTADGRGTTRKSVLRLTRAAGTMRRRTLTAAGPSCPRGAGSAASRTSVRNCTARARPGAAPRARRSQPLALKRRYIAGTIREGWALRPTRALSLQGRRHRSSQYATGAADPRPRRASNRRLAHQAEYPSARLPRAVARPCRQCQYRLVARPSCTVRPARVLSESDPLQRPAAFVD